MPGAERCAAATLFAVRPTFLDGHGAEEQHLLWFAPGGAHSGRSGNEPD
jgi:hypothetical protein